MTLPSGFFSLPELISLAGTVSRSLNRRIVALQVLSYQLLTEIDNTKFAAFVSSRFKGIRVIEIRAVATARK